VGLDDVFRFSTGYMRNPDIPAAAKWAWESDNAFVAEYDTIGSIDRWRVELAFEGDELTLKMESITEHFSFTFGGRLEE
jgi:hypothetical protein